MLTVYSVNLHQLESCRNLRFEMERSSDGGVSSSAAVIIHGS